MNKNFDGAKILRKNKDYQSIEQAKMFYEKRRLTELSTILFPEDEYPEGFKELLIKLMKFQNPVQMQVWHNEKTGIKDEKGNFIATTWINMCTFQRKFACAEMYQCIEILRRCTPNEVCNQEIFVSYFNSLSEYSNEVLRYFNEIVYPKIEKIVLHIQDVLDGIEEQVCKPIRDKINADLKIMNQLPITDTTEFIKGKERRM